MRILSVTIIVMALLAFAKLVTLDTSDAAVLFDARTVAGCIAEQAYTHPRPDRWVELVNAVELCRPVILNER